MPQIPISSDVAKLIGPYAQGVENRSLLLDKYSFHKSWPIETDPNNGRAYKWDDASRWSFVRVAQNASMLLNSEAQQKRKNSDKPNVTLENAERLKKEATIASALSNTRQEMGEITSLRAEHTLSFIRLFLSNANPSDTVFIGKLEDRMAINLADSLIPNAGIALDRLFGQPYIPGSAIKGVARHTAIKSLEQADDNHKEELFHLFRKVFGSSDVDFKKGSLVKYKHLLKPEEYCLKGAVNFLPAYPTTAAKLEVDVCTVHYPSYYKKGNSASLKLENPIPNFFPVVEKGACFAFCLSGNNLCDDPSIVDQAKAWLQEAITVNGVGAKTASGYGWFSIDDSGLEEIKAGIEQEKEKLLRQKVEAAKVQAEQAEAAKEAARIESLPPVERDKTKLSNMSDQEFAEVAKSLNDDDTNQDLQLAFIQLLHEDKDKKKKWKTWKKKKPNIAAIIEAVNEKHNLPDLP